MRFPLPVPAVRHALIACVAILGMTCAGCQMYRSLGKGQHLEAPRPRPHHDVARGGQEMEVEVITDATGGVANVRFLKSSGSEAVDQYVAESIRGSWPAVASTRTVAKLKHVANGGFSEPVIVSSTPLQ